MADNRKYYYLKLKENFFDSDSIVLLEDMKDGILYSNILLKLYLKSLKNGGKLQLDEHIPYTAQMIATLTRHQIGTVERALEIFRQLGLVEQLDSGAFYMTDIELMIGQSSTEAERKRQPLIRPRHIARIRTGELASRKECIGTLLNILRFPRKPRFSGGIRHVAQPEIVEWPRHRAFFLHCPHTVKQKLAEIDMLRTDFLAKPAVVAGADQSGRPRTIAR